MAVSDYSTTAASNTSISGIDITGATGLVKNGDNAIRQMMADIRAAVDGVTSFSGLLYGLTLSNNGSDATNDIDVAVGVAIDSGNAGFMRLTSAMTKQLDAAWAVGTNQGMRATGVAIANTTYHIFLIKRPDTGVVDIAADTDASGANIAANTNAAYTLKRRIGSIIRSGGAIVAFKQNGDDFVRDVISADVSDTNPGTSAVTPTLSVPTGVVVTASVVLRLVDASPTTNASALLTSIDQTNTAPGASAFNVRLTNTGAATSEAASAFVKTNTSGQIRYRLSSSDADISISILTVGWADTRGA